MLSKQRNNDDDEIGTSREDNTPKVLSTEEVVTRLSLLSCNAKPSKASHDKLRRASVLILLLDDVDVYGEAHLLFTVRSKKLRSHPGDVCFPGGKRQEDVDVTDIDTALRETMEEISLSSSSIEIICTLPTAQSANRLCVTPIVGRWIKKGNNDNDTSILDDLTLCPTEVETAFTAPLRMFLNPNGDEPLQYVEWEGEMFSMRAYHYTDTSSNNREIFRIWGLTAHIAHALACLAYSKQPLSSSMNAQDIVKIIDNTNEPETAERKSNHHTHPSSFTSNENGTQTSKQKQQPQQQEGYLHFLVQNDQQSFSYWKRQYFVLSGTYNSKNTSTIVTRNRSVLHCFPSQSDSLKKKNSATKKNRLLLHNTYFDIMDANDTTKKDSLYYFQISAYNDQIVWKLAADDHATFLSWKESLLASGCQNNDLKD